jgi:2-polyprenyl-3-methyl-5-hydroxy-6-metoxy-1,4-benzoquinol methylase
MRAFYSVLTTELNNRAQNITAGKDMMGQYYKSLLNEPELQQFYRYNWQRRIQPMVQLLQTMPRREEPWRILDAGCGVGTEALLWASLRDDVEVIGVDISAARLRAASARVSFYEQQVGRPLSAKFCDQSVFTVLKEKNFDLIWTMEAISHIDPAEAFVADSYTSLNVGGHLVISDSHFLNPAMLWRIFKLRRQGIRHTYKTTSTGETISYAEERLFTVPQLTRLLYQAGFKTVQTQISIYFPPRLLTSTMFQAADRILNRLPLVRHLGGIYTVSAHK